MTWEAAKEACFDTDVVAACHNDVANVTLSGPADSVDALVERLRAQGVTVSMVDSARTAFHSPMLQECGQSFLEALTKVFAVVGLNALQETEKWN